MDALMTSPKLLFSLLVLTLLLSISPPSCASVEDGHGIDSVAPPSFPLEPQLADHHQKVDLTIYYGTLCSACASFIEQLLPLLISEEDLMAIINLRLVPSGNVRVEGPNDTVVCEHGQDECYLNSIQACAISVWPNVKQHLPFISCVEYLAVKEHRLKEDVWKYCCQIHNMSHEPLLTCYKSGYERKLMLHYILETYGLDPPLTCVPWVVVNQKPLYYDYQNFERYVCEAYEGYPKPRTCSRFIAPPGLLSWSSSAETTNFAIRSYILHLLLLRAALLLVN
ncbi:gamma-interferon-responsive lysosomal thiol protein-like isoform X1 [Malus sylvestris]|uniref:gamma-interferon-responsive lysosomal thiol protein-like isoform X1 n=1 Tax=Malus sylvestris TaxID=3752 RepID=UPI0021ACCF78|nr:gamma-interferon-responsive lysosomal thiol protein-like isoform X1 [Malus sylvestris]XP_050143973.1 gamma-interferon-responsive lysosomal thiol protein-like isoform X1 [Malus sylvestris]